MNILFASKDRDLLKCYQLLLSDEDTAVDTAFDGIQVLNAIAAKKYDILIVSQDIPRITCRQIVEHAKSMRLPVIVLTQKKTGLNILLDDVLANDYLEMPFVSEELKKEIDDVICKAGSEEELDFGDFSVKTSDFSMGKLPVTAREMDILSALYGKRELSAEKDGIFINAINGKLSKQGFRKQIRYEKNNGFRLVTENE